MLIYLQMIETSEDKSKMEIIYLKYRNYMYRVAFAILNNPQDAEDALHGAFVKLANNMHKVGDAECIKTKNFVVTIVRRTAIDIYRRKQKHPHIEYCDALQGVSVEYDGENLAAACILKLKDRQRDLMILKYYHGCDLREIADILGITYRNALQIEQRAKAKLRILCQKEGLEC